MFYCINFQKGCKFFEGVQISMRGTYLGGKNLILQISSTCTYFVGTNSLRGTYNFMTYIGTKANSLVPRSPSHNEKDH